MKVIETFLRDNRFYVRIENGESKISTMPRANHVWLKFNPSFKEIPKGYSIHHLDGDQTNDDPSNLALMQKYHHTAYHWKQKTIETKVEIRDYFIDLPFLKKPPIVKKRRNIFYLYASNNGEDHRIWRKSDGASLLTRLEAIKLAEEIFQKKGYEKTW
jgi:hypothetical protein